MRSSLACRRRRILIWKTVKGKGAVLLYMIVVGAIAGFLADEVFLDDRFQLLGNILLGVVGAVVGGLIFDRMGGSSRRGLLRRIVVAFIGAAIAIFVYVFIKDNM